MTWAGENSTSGVYIFKDDGSPSSIAGLDGQFLAWSGGVPVWATIQAGSVGPQGPAGSGDFSSNTSDSVTGEVVVFANNTGKLGKRAVETGVAHLTAGVVSASNVLESEITLADNTTNDFNSARHGFVPKAPTFSNRVLNDDGTWRLGCPIVKELAATQSHHTITPIRVSGLEMPCGVGTWVFNYALLYQSTLQTCGVRLSVNHTGTVSAFVANIRWVDASATASTAAPDQNQVGAAGHVMGSFSARAKSTAGWGTTISVDTINADMLMIVEGLAVVTASGNLDLWHGSEVGSPTSIRQNSAVILNRIA